MRDDYFVYIRRLFLTRRQPLINGALEVGRVLAAHARTADGIQR